MRTIIFSRRILTFSRTLRTHQLLPVNSSLVEKVDKLPPVGNDTGNGGKNEGKKSWWRGLWASFPNNLLILAVTFGFPIVGGYASFRYNRWSILNSIDKTIKTGTRPELSIEKEDKVDRTDKLNTLIKAFINAGGKSFGVILGPTGTGKTQLIKEACCKSSEGALYFELTNRSLSVTELAATLGIHIGQPTFWEIVIKKYFNNYVGYYTLPESKSEQIRYVFKCFEERAKLYKAKAGRPPCVFIDGVDLVAKSDKAIFEALVETAKTLANRGNVRIVFGCSEGHIIPLIDEMSEKSRVRIMEILDLPDKQGEEYLKKHEVTDSLAKRVIDYAGSRMIFLVRAVDVFQDCQKVGIQDENILFDEIIGDLHGIFVGRGITAIARGWPLSIEILKDLQKRENDLGLVLSDYQDEQRNDWKVRREEAIRELIRANVLRYTTQVPESTTQVPEDTTQSPGKAKEVRVAWHSKLMKNKVTKMKAFK